ncbi:toxin-antitoxin system YwqK family antitoxin [Mucilaginibacter jinjuensis]|uniref:MORN repeat protein n=1 Tax=Mucilaginibacter jinjuensis TaxID=1176721 RepID=A0ABY7TER0_9SPHI|nr:hypothetical protein [Mucilaginibacter jinjuensis]WCT13657.1 hypothetical protein PQO05_06875 [Mucilaginibacter jinjuensis]
MKKIILLIIFPFYSLAQKMPDLGITKVRIVKMEETIVAELGPVSHHIDVQNDKLYYWYSSNNVHATQGGYSGDLLNGLYTVYYSNKGLKEQGAFKNGLKEGVWKTWNESGTLSRELTWKKGLINGDFRSYNEQGKLIQEGNYKDNLLEGRSKLYLGNDSTRVIKYHHGQIDNARDLSIWQRLYLVKRKTDSTAIKPVEKKHPKPNPGDKTSINKS